MSESCAPHGPAPGGHQRLTRRAVYTNYMASASWLRRRAWWFREHRRCTREPAECAVCGTTKNLELHHHDYLRLGREAYGDLIALCAAHHRRLHDIYDASHIWRSLGRRAASTGIIRAMRTPTASIRRAWITPDHRSAAAPDAPHPGAAPTPPTPTLRQP